MDLPQANAGGPYGSAVLRGVQGGVGKRRMRRRNWYEILIIDYKNKDVGLRERLVCSGGGCCRPLNDNLKKNDLHTVCACA